MFNFNDLPSGWEAMWDPNTRQHFFVDHNTQSTTWRDPRRNFRNPNNFDINDQEGYEIPIQRDTNVFNKQDSNYLNPTYPCESERSRCRSASPFLISSLDSIHKISDEVKSLEKRVDAFKGTSADKEYLYLENILERQLLRLDTLESEGESEIRTARKETVNYVQSILDRLERKYRDNLANQTTAVEDNKEQEMKAEDVENHHGVHKPEMINVID